MALPLPLDLVSGSHYREIPLVVVAILVYSRIWAETVIGLIVVTTVVRMNFRCDVNYSAYLKRWPFVVTRLFATTKLICGKVKSQAPSVHPPFKSPELMTGTRWVK